MTTFDRRRPEETGTETADMGTGTAAGYVNPYAGQIQDMYQSITERGPFQYDVNADALYQSLRDQYISGGQMAMMDTMGQAAQMTGGYGNSYAQGVGQQAYQGYLQGLNDQIPDLYSMALQNYIQQGDAMMQQYGMLQDMAADDYTKWLDQRKYDYQVSRDEADDAFRDEQFAYQQEQDQADTDYRNQQDARELAFAMLEAGTMPSAEMLAAAGLTQEVVGALYPNLMPGAAGTAGGNNGVNVNTQSNWYANAMMNEGWLDSADGKAWLSSEQGQNWLLYTVIPDAVELIADGEKTLDETVTDLQSWHIPQNIIDEVQRQANAR